MVCEHLISLEKELKSLNIKEDFRGKAWTDNCREWVYYDCVFTNLEKTMLRLHINTELVQIHSHIGTHDGHEYGLACNVCKDAIMGRHPEMAKKFFYTGSTFE